MTRLVVADRADLRRCRRSWYALAVALALLTVWWMQAYDFARYFANTGNLQQLPMMAYPPAGDFLERRPDVAGVLFAFKNAYATYQCVLSYRAQYPHTTLILLSDNGYDYSGMAYHFNATAYLHEREHIPLAPSGEGADRVRRQLKLMSRFRRVLRLIPETYFIWLEDDVVVHHRVPLASLRYDLNGYAPNALPAELVANLARHFPHTAMGRHPSSRYVYSGHGGSIFRTETLLLALENRAALQTVLGNSNSHNGAPLVVAHDVLVSVLVYVANGTIGAYEGHADADFDATGGKV
jgi:hypothetical protein